MRKTVTVLGVTGSGKSTWIGALTDGLYRGAVSRVKFDEENWPDNTTGIDQARSYLQTGQFPIHTSEEMRTLVELPIRVSRGPNVHEAFTLKMSDYDGELIEKLFTDRTHGWDDAWSRRARADSFLILIRHDFTKCLRPLVRPGRKLRQDGMLSLSPDDLAAPPLLNTSVPPAPLSSFDDPRYVPTSLALIELLQWIRDARGLSPIEQTPIAEPLRIGIVLTAWDAVDGRWRNSKPEEFLAVHHAILRDYLRCNFRDDEVRVFSLSATGGDLSDHQFRQRYLSATDPVSRVWWTNSRGDVVEDADLSIPLCWALFGESGITP